MTQQSMYVKIRGRVHGPLDVSRLQEMAQSGRLSRVHLLSIDGETWEKASEFPAVFQASEPVQKKSPSSDTSLSGKSENKSHSALLNPEPSWYYAKDGERAGPEPQSKIDYLIRSSQLSGTDLVWREGMEDWQPISDVSLFAAKLPDAKAARKVQINERGNTSSGNKDLQRVVRSQHPWVVFIHIFLYVLTALLMISFIVLLIRGSKENNGPMVIQSVTCFIQAGLSFTAALFLQQYSTRIKRYFSSGDAIHLEDAMNALGRFWIFLSIVLIVFLAFLGTAVVYALAIAGAIP